MKNIIRRLTLFFSILIIIRTSIFSQEEVAPVENIIINEADSKENDSSNVNISSSKVKSTNVNNIRKKAKSVVKEKLQSVKETSSSIPFFKIAIIGILLYFTWVSVKFYFRRKRERFLETERIIEKIKNEEEIERNKKLIEKENNDRKTLLIDKYGEENGLLIFEKKIRMDMTEEMLLDSWGKSGKIEVDVSKNKKIQYYYYGPFSNERGKIKYSRRVKVENGIIIAWKDGKF